jgi:hypothetical protein
VPVAVNCCVLPIEIEGFAGATAIETSIGGVTVRVVEPAIVPDIAVIVVLPCAATLVATPAALIVATVGIDELHDAMLVRFCILPSL